MSNNPFEALAALRDSLPPGEELTPTTPARKDRKPELSIFYERKGRNGKDATIITGFDNMDDSEVTDLASRLKKHLGTGGSARGGEILLQGDRRAQVAKWLRADGFRVKG